MKLEWRQDRNDDWWAATPYEYNNYMIGHDKHDKDGEVLAAWGPFNFVGAWKVGPLAEKIAKKACQLDWDLQGRKDAYQSVLELFIKNLEAEHEADLARGDAQWEHFTGSPPKRAT